MHKGVPRPFESTAWATSELDIADAKEGDLTSLEFGIGDVGVGDGIGGSFPEENAGGACQEAMDFVEEWRDCRRLSRRASESFLDETREVCFDACDRSLYFSNLEA